MITVVCPDREQKCSTVPEHATDALQGLPIPPYDTACINLKDVFDSLVCDKPPSSARFQDEAGPSTSHFHTTTQSEVSLSYYKVNIVDLWITCILPLNTSPIPYREHYQTVVHDMATGDNWPITYVAQDPPQGDEDQGHHHRHRTVRHSRCETGGYRPHH
ncbi:hypothetical protein F511_27978 [Dorcoceras hygrometricum]|uniref:Uncharacterized protein n=1 Tax=Dorcoceras hygrometricum TaxID=472368 RepID=A0A2Z7BR33_9LAMI|nr:hypothetical protein F511_27978 [Dorcoceras hygrometricum]